MSRSSVPEARQLEFDAQTDERHDSSCSTRSEDLFSPEPPASLSNEHLNPKELERLKDYTTDELGRKIPAPPHKNREQLLERHRAHKRSSDGLIWPIRLAQRSKRRAQRELQMRAMNQQTSSGDRTRIPRSPAFIEPLYPHMPIYGPPSPLQRFRIWYLQLFSFFCTAGFLLVVLLGAVVTCFIPEVCKRIVCRLLLQDPDKDRKFVAEERSRKKEQNHHVKVTDDIHYYASLQEITVTEFTCETMDGFTLHLQRLHDSSLSAVELTGKRYPVLLLHGLLQSSGAFCTNDQDSLAFYLCKQGFDVWLGNNRCWVRPEHSVLGYNDPRLWAWNIRQLGGLDLPALIGKVCKETSRERIGFVGHSQGTTQTFCSLSRDQQPEIGLKMDSFCALAPAVYAGALIDKLQFKFMRALGSKGFRLFFGTNAFIPLMMSFQKILPGSWYGQIGYLVFNFLFGWSDALWDRRLKSRFFQFSPVYVSSESMRWWMRDFALFRCILEDTNEVWYHKEHFPPLAFWTCGQDQLVNGQKFADRISEKEHEVTVVHRECIEEYSHLDVLWAMDAISRVGVKVKEVLWACASDRESLITPHGCENIPQRPDPRKQKHCIQ